MFRIYQRLVFVVVLGVLAAGCATAPRPHAEHAVPDGTYNEKGLASWYGPGFHGRKTASGERFNQKALTCAHKKLPFGSLLKVTNLNNDKWVVVRVNDRGPFVRSRIVDLSKQAAHEIGLISTGTAPVQIETVRVDEL